MYIVYVILQQFKGVIWFKYVAYAYKGTTNEGATGHGREGASSA